MEVGRHRRAGQVLIAGRVGKGLAVEHRRPAGLLRAGGQALCAAAGAGNGGDAGDRAHRETGNQPLEIDRAGMLRFCDGADALQGLSAERR